MNLADLSPISSSRIQENLEKIGLRIRYQGRVSTKLQFDLERYLKAALEINTTLKILQVSATIGEGMEEW